MVTRRAQRNSYQENVRTSSRRGRARSGPGMLPEQVACASREEAGVYAGSEASARHVRTEASAAPSNSLASLKRFYSEAGLTGKSALLRVGPGFARTTEAGGKLISSTGSMQGAGAKQFYGTGRRRESVARVYIKQGRGSLPSTAAQWKNTSERRMEHRRRRAPEVYADARSVEVKAQVRAEESADNRERYAWASPRPSRY